MKTTIQTPPTFNYERDVLSHGLCKLLPVDFDFKHWTLTRDGLGEARPLRW